MEPWLVKGCQNPKDILLRMSGENPDAKNAKGETALMKVCANPGRYALEFTQVLLGGGAQVPPDPYLLEQLTLSNVVLYKMTKAIRLLSQAGVPVTEKGSEGRA